jgi:hypothetical protein
MISARNPNREAGRPRTPSSYIANEGISFMGITPEVDQVIIGDIAICLIENAGG